MQFALVLELSGLLVLLIIQAPNSIRSLPHYTSPSALRLSTPLFHFSGTLGSEAPYLILRVTFPLHWTLQQVPPTFGSAVIVCMDCPSYATVFSILTTFLLHNPFPLPTPHFRPSPSAIMCHSTFSKENDRDQGYRSLIDINWFNAATRSVNMFEWEN